MSTITSAFPRLLAVTALVGGLAVAGPAFAAGTDTGVPASTTAPAPGAKHHMGKPMAEDVESHIKALHDKLKISADQEDSWATVAQAMRDNDAAMKTQWKQRHDNGESQSAR